MTVRDIDTISLDLDGTLVRYERSGQTVLDLAFETAGVDPFFDARDWMAKIDAITVVGISGDEHRTLCFTELAEEHGYDATVAEAVADAYAEERDHGNVSFLPGAQQALDALSEEYDIGIITNGPPEMQQPKLDAVGIDDWIDTVVHAGYDFPPKPDPEPFNHFLDLFDTTPERTLHVGNSLTSDVAGAKAAGLHAAWLPADPSFEPDPTPDYAFESMDELRARPWKQN